MLSKGSALPSSFRQTSKAAAKQFQQVLADCVLEDCTAAWNLGRKEAFRLVVSRMVEGNEMLERISEVTDLSLEAVKEVIRDLKTKNGSSDVCNDGEVRTTRSMHRKDSSESESIFDSLRVEQHVPPMAVHDSGISKGQSAHSNLEHLSVNESALYVSPRVESPPWTTGKKTGVPSVSIKTSRGEEEDRKTVIHMLPGREKVCMTATGDSSGMREEPVTSAASYFASPLTSSVRIDCEPQRLRRNESLRLSPAPPTMAQLNSSRTNAGKLVRVQEKYVTIMDEEISKFLEHLHSNISIHAEQRRRLENFIQSRQGFWKLTHNAHRVRQDFELRKWELVEQWQRYTGNRITGGDFEVHHIVPVFAGGSNDWWNIVCIQKKEREELLKQCPFAKAARMAKDSNDA